MYDNVMRGLGERIKKLRKSRRLTLLELSKKTRIDMATLSRVENGKMTGTLDSHMQIADALGVRLPDLYEQVIDKVYEKKDEQARKRVETYSHSSGAVAELLTTGVLQKKMMPVILKLKSGGHTVTEEYSAITERFIYVTKGALEIRLRKEVCSLKQGESLYFDASLPHSFRNPLKSETEALSILTPASL